MSNAVSLLTALLTAVLAGGAITAYLWLYRRRRAETKAGIDALATMRWREFSRLVVEALQPRGFEPESVEQTLERGTQSEELRLQRDGRPWLLACKQGHADYQVSAAVVAEFANAVRFAGASGGVLATPGRIADVEVRGTELERYDGPALWALVRPLLPESLRNDLTASTRKRVMRETLFGWAAAIVLGALASLLLPDPPRNLDAAPVAPIAAAPAAAAPPAATAEPVLTAPAPADPNREQYERAEVMRMVSSLPNVERALWSTSSTLLVYQLREDDQTDAKEICTILERYAFLRSSRLQLQPPPGSDKRVRFLQCKTY
ncbi:MULTISPECIES: restriction endonuclease [unclassified Lysobacter]|uniref:restriction endonuclease n=1 Tax=unclassified Lysobacter TaxID=2635362 RepID=UPI0006F32CA3|nr:MULTISPECIES: restriction endonuclease [unclassified Lysobacter]KRA20570.1 hypothetical protein ASD69_04385 [Lysobacter sp. Root604]KRD39590.1 hypothetical protein ASE35_04415 [Lysobacter sp. Root916]KRD79557.1 hypothetical protein ASE43_01180 [Lysobacter sp. Root983]